VRTPTTFAIVFDLKDRPLVTPHKDSVSIHLDGHSTEFTVAQRQHLRAALSYLDQIVGETLDETITLGAAVDVEA
jgi:hypothetical protein